jgi:hypothetical protein
MTVIERKVMGSMQRRIGPNVVGYYALLQLFVFILKTAIIVFSVLTIFTILSSFSTPIFCEDEVTISIKDETMIAHNSNFWKAYGSLSIYSIYKGLQAKTFLGKYIGTIGLITASGIATYTMHSVTNPAQPAGVTARINQILEQKNKSGNTASNTASNTGSSYPVHSPLEEAYGRSIIDWLFSLLPDSLKTGLRNRVPASSFEELDAMDVLHFQYNLVVILLVISVFIIAYCYLMITVLGYLKNNRVNIASKSTLLGKLIPSDNQVRILTIVLQSSAMLNIVTIFIGLHFLFTQPFLF